uniref:Uncharacterized protein n=1 Tax=Craspedostauros australis TaxID=1486917 RepID=A0A7R9ZPG0_9STRA|mmetsp:Transcript_4917/g.12980  ORF Transcript_4917/g.12980 Transcript_4917/m.12980 type:complete len:279 (+) Transcript_4917:843-1679(+)|eukprot:CAMPEP_0198136316 /NCGR_PEP_ID=MMETSP1442-20131203/61049_1 /TAXON_ID= /ORGANISM="Craspedostauros australis, Strain CCMP3328" /LENGTH=278 /DNA_ID=CAMNT_0043797529 /DNA_START=1286 /DNA_END=2122 /DNA_ORIENTATION=+
MSPSNERIVIADYPFKSIHRSDGLGCSSEDSSSSMMSTIARNDNSAKQKEASSHDATPASPSSTMQSSTATSPLSAASCTAEETDDHGESNTVQTTELDADPRSLFTTSITTNERADSQSSTDKIEQRSARKSVRFAEHNEVHDTLHVNDFTDVEFSSSWLSDVDFQIITEMARITIELIELGESEDASPQLCFRGLRSRTWFAEEKLRRRHQNLVAVVLEEQDFQASRAICDHEYIAELCSMHTKDSVLRARARAEQDHCDAIQEPNSCRTNMKHFV